jgi:hypothetical protein
MSSGFIASTSRKFKSEFSKCLDKNGFSDWFIDDGGKEGAFFGDDFRLFVTCRSNYFKVSKIYRTKELKLTRGVLVMIIGRSDHTGYLFTGDNRHVYITDDHIKA